MFKVLNWDRHFEGAKSKTYNNKTSCSLPTKHGLGYRRLIRSENGPAMFGAWCSLIQVLSRHPKPRNGYCSDNGRSDGVPYTFEDLEMLTDIPAEYFEQMLDLCKSHTIGWVALVKVKDITGDCEGTILPLNSDSNLDSDLDLNSDLDSNSTADAHKDFLNEVAVAMDKKATEHNCKVKKDQIKIFAESFYSHYKSKGWRIGREKIVDKIACAEKWILTEISNGKIKAAR